MEWVEISAKTIEEAKDLALDQLGVDESEAEFQIMSEPKKGLLGRLTSEARIRARVLPAVPRPKDNRRKRRSPREKSEGTPRKAAAKKTAKKAVKPRAKKAGTRPRKAASTKTSEAKESSKENKMPVDPPIAEQAEIAKDFLEGLLDSFEFDAPVRIEEIDEETAQLHVDGSDLGLLIGPGGKTLAAVQDLARTVVQRKSGGSHGRLLVDVGGYREKRKEALAKFTKEVAEQVLAEGGQKSLEPMSPADRKVVHDTVNEIDGIKTISEGEEPRRRVVLVKED